jgi:ABC-type sugar transport system ATPase subunit
VTELNALAQAASGIAAPGVAVSAPPAKASGSVVDELIEHPWTPYGAGALVALMALLVWGRSRQRANQENPPLDDYSRASPAEASPPSPFNFDLELDAQPTAAPQPQREAATPVDASQTDLNDAPPPSDYEVRLNLAEELWDMGQQNTARALADEVAEFSGLGEFIDLPIRGYSAGMNVRLSFAMATAITPEILLMDEWFLAGDADFMAKAEERLTRLVTGADILVIATHDMAIVRQWCTRAIKLDSGRIIADGPVEEVLGPAD